MRVEPPVGLYRVHAITGVIPLAAYLLVHVRQTSSALGGRSAFSRSIWGADGGAAAIAAEILLILVPLLLHVGGGIFMAWQGRGAKEAGAFPSHGLRSVQRATGLMAFAFIVLHLSHTWVLKLSGVGATGEYNSLMADLGRPVFLVVYVVGITCVFFHFAQGLTAVVRAFGLVRTDFAYRSARLVFGLAALILWLITVNTVSHFSAGEGVLWGGLPDQAEVVE